MSTEDKAPDPFGLISGDGPAEAAPDPFGSSEGAPSPFGPPPETPQAPFASAEQAGPAADPYAALDAASSGGVKVEQPESGYDDIFGGAPPSNPSMPSQGAPVPPAMGHMEPTPGMDPGMLSDAGMMGGFPPPDEGPTGPRLGSGEWAPKKSSGGASKIMLLVLAVGLAGGGWFLFGRGESPTEVEPVAEQPTEVLPEIDLDAVLAERPRNAPRCWRTNDGFAFVYKDASGSAIVKENIEDVPTLYRAKADCKRL